MNLTLGTRCYEIDRGGDQLPRGGIVIGALARPNRVVVASSWGRRTKGRRAAVPFLDISVLEVDSIDEATVEQVSYPERIKLARGIASVFGERSSNGRSDQDDRDLFVIAELMRPALSEGSAYAGPIDPRYADGIDLEDALNG